LSGMQVFEAMFDGRLPSPPIGTTLDFLPVHIEPGFAVFQGKPGFQHYNPLGTVHGGWFATLLDSAVGCAVHSSLPAGKGYTTGFPSEARDARPVASPPRRPSGVSQEPPQTFTFGSARNCGAVSTLMPPVGQKATSGTGRPEPSAAPCRRPPWPGNSFRKL
jgi:hypothetical protein